MSHGSTDSSNVSLGEDSLRLRRLVMRALVSADKGHIGSALSLIEILHVLYRKVIRHDPRRPAWERRDRVILSKGHGCLALYAVLADNGYFPVELLDTFCARHSPLGGHPERDIERGIEASTGALGHGFPYAVGIAVAHQRLRDGVRVFAVVGDGELNEGSNWEALLIAAKYRLSNLVLVVDNNGQQISGDLERVLPMEPFRAKLEAFGARVIEVNGHHVDDLVGAFQEASECSDRPVALVCRTVKGKGLLEAERNPEWHYKRTITDDIARSMNAQWRSRSEAAS